MLRNTASQKWRVFAFNRTTGAPVTGDAANITAKISGDYGAAVALADTNPEETEDGYYLFDFTQAETNFGNIAIYPESSSPDVQVLGDPTSQNTVQTDSYQVTYTITTVPDRVSIYLTTDVGGTTRAESMSGTFRSNESGVLTLDLAPGTYYAWSSKPGWTFTAPVAIAVGVAPNAATITGTDTGDEYASSWAEYYGAVFPSEANVVAGVEYSDGVEEWVGIATTGSTATPDTQSMYLSVGATPEKTIVCNQDISDKSVVVVFQALGATTDIAVVGNASVTKSGAMATFIVPSAASAIERTLNVSVRDIGNKQPYASVLVFVTSEALED